MVFDVTYILNQWAASGVFAYVLPFLIVFAVIYGVLSKTKIFGEENRGVNIVLALAVGALSLVGDYVPMFFQRIFPNLGIGISFLVAAIVLIGLFMTNENETIKKTANWIIALVAITIFIVVAYSSMSDYAFGGIYIWQEYGSAIVVLGILIGLIYWVTKAR
ncbi:hypothetical protein FJZ17_00185 [Candidatus Pacearchaeota archaeon]|nr:hypothetical protein [Candidatus Pacearchaeota archaeon]